jgi:hypothetical protein
MQKPQVKTWGFFIACRTLTRDCVPGYSACGLTPSGLRLRAFGWRRRAQVAEPNTKPQVKTWGFFACLILAVLVCAQLLRRPITVTNKKPRRGGAFYW